MMEQMINILRMADHLWEQYCRVGFLVAMGDRERHALMRTAWHTYTQFCRLHGVKY